MSSIRSKRIELVDGAVVGIGAGAYFKTANDSFVVKANDGSTNLFTISNAGAVTLGIEGQNVNIPGTLQIDGSSVTSSQWTDQSSNIHFSTGFVGIGSATPTATLDVLGTVFINVNTDTLVFDSSTTSFTFNQYNTGSVGIGATGTSKLAVGGNASFGETYGDIQAPINGILVEGNVGIGSSTPSVKLDVVGDAVFTGTVSAGGASITGTVSINTSGTSNTSIGNAGNGTVGIAASTVNIAGTVGINASNALNTTIGNSTGSVTVNGDLIADTDTLFVDSSASMVGIGKTDPTVKLDVVGDAVFTGTVSAAQPTDDSHLATKYYVDSSVQGLDIKVVTVASTGDNLLLTELYAGQSLDNISLNEGDRILLKDQSSAIENGIYIVQAASNPLVRASDFNSAADNVQGCVVYVVYGGDNNNSCWLCTNNGPITFGSTSINFETSSLEYGISSTDTYVNLSASNISFLSTKLSYNKNVYELSSLIKISEVTLANSLTSFNLTLPGKTNNFESNFDLVGILAGYVNISPITNIENCFIHSVSGGKHVIYHLHQVVQIRMIYISKLLQDILHKLTKFIIIFYN